MWLKKIRVASALFFLVVSALLFVDFNRIGTTPATTAALYPQFVPSLLKYTQTLAWSATGFLAVLILTLLFGRVYCSAICPLGTLQDLITRLANTVSKPRKFKFKPQKTYNAWRYGVLAVAVGLFLSGSTLALTLLDPFSSFGRIASDLLRPVYVAVHNGAGQALESLGWAGPFPLAWKAPPLTALAFPALFLLGLIGLSARHGRLFCNTLCPVGALLGLVSRFAWFKIRIPKDACILCVQCTTHCKAGCIRLKTKEVDFSRCVACFNCITVCEAHGIGYARAAPVASQSVIPLTSPPQPEATECVADARQVARAGQATSGGAESRGGEQNPKPDPNRRALLRVSALTLVGWAALPGAPPVQAKPRNRVPTRVVPQKTWPTTPPGAGNLARFNTLCTACHLCSGACPYGVLQPALLDYGWSGLLQPHMDYASGYCSYECNLCSQLCPTGALRPLDLLSKQTVQLGVAHFIRANCIVYTDHTPCRVCSEYCPTKAVRLVSYQEGLSIPEVQETLCVGCGACENACPTRPHRAIYVAGHAVQQRAERSAAKPSAEAR